jgi:GxxExxY protein
MNADEAILNKLSKQIIGCAFVVANTLGQGFAEKVYENSLVIELRSRGLGVEQQSDIVVKYGDAVVGEYAADIIVEHSIIIEPKATKALDPAHMDQCLNYLKATGLRMCLLINFGGPRVEVKRVVLNL